MPRSSSTSKILTPTNSVQDAFGEPNLCLLKADVFSRCCTPYLHDAILKVKEIKLVTPDLTRAIKDGDASKPRVTRRFDPSQCDDEAMHGLVAGSSVDKPPVTRKDAVVSHWITSKLQFTIVARDMILSVSPAAR